MNRYEHKEYFIIPKNKSNIVSQKFKNKKKKISQRIQYFTFHILYLRKKMTRI